MECRELVRNRESTNGQYHRVQVQDNEEEILPVDADADSQDDQVPSTRYGFKLFEKFRKHLT